MPIEILEQFPALRALPQFDPQNLTASDVLRILSVVLANTPHADSNMKLRAAVYVEEQYARGNRDGYARGTRDGYDKGYREGLEDGRTEALAKAAMEEAEFVSIKANARARRLPKGGRGA